MSTIAGIKIPDSTMARDLTELIRDTESDRARSARLRSSPRTVCASPRRSPRLLGERAFAQ
jgi:hypothetical protein